MDTLIPPQLDTAHAAAMAHGGEGDDDSRVAAATVQEAAVVVDGALGPW